MAYFAPMPDGPGAPAGAEFDAGGHPPPGLTPADAASVLTLLESAYDAADAQDLEVLPRLRRTHSAVSRLVCCKRRGDAWVCQQQRGCVGHSMQLRILQRSRATLQQRGGAWGRLAGP